ncbi:piggyBac transposable element-derived protein 4-like [Diachasma alloeum]|uniref:piggyBac transposable element-derived protein 4-like n=1 Tax=Diachasma alloeum TaxID=454923 RepID=UPI0007382F58|nr:piggyBac transposable element-derived protein 4-like [Diachasma alloeum]
MAGRARRVLQEEDHGEFAEDLGDGSDSDYSDEEPSPQCDDNDDSMESEDAESTSNSSGIPQYYLGKDKRTKWFTEMPSKDKTRQKNILTETPGGSFWVTIFVWWSTNDKNNTRDLWATDGTAPGYFRTVMSENRFRLLLRALRFDDSETREARKQTDKLAAIRDLWEDITAKFLKMYRVGECVTLDEMMLAFKGRCSFRQYLPMKPNRYRLKVFALVDSDTFYTSVLEIYTGKQPPGLFQADNKPINVVKRVSASVLGTGRNITMDNWFSSVPLIDELQHKHRTTVVATLKKNKTELPPQFVNHKKRSMNSSLIGYNDGKVLVSYVPKKNKCAIAISSMHTSGAIDSGTGARNKPEVITYYNSTKGGVDSVDQMRGNYSVARCSCRWPLTVFFGLLDIVGINSWIIYEENTGQTISCKEYLTGIAKDLTKPWMMKRIKVPTLSPDLRIMIRKFTGIRLSVGNVMSETLLKLCKYCPKKKYRKTTVECGICQSLICGEHTSRVCTECFARINFLEE